MNSPLIATQSRELLGYTVLASIRRRGCALEAAQGMMDWALREHDVRLLRISIAPNNTPSLAMAANRAERPS